MIRISLSKSTVGSQSRSNFALMRSPIRWSTSAGRSRRHPHPALRHKEAPPGHETAAWKPRIKFGVALRQALAARVDKGGHAEAAPFCQIPQTLEDCAIAEPVRVSDQLVHVSVPVAEIGRKAVGDVLDAGSDVHVIKHVNDGAVNVRYGDASSSAPDGLRAEDPVLLNALQREVSTVVVLAPLAHRPCRHHDNVAEDLLRQIPVFGSSPTAHVRRFKKHRNKHPGIVKNQLAGQGLEANRRV